MYVDILMTHKVHQSNQLRFGTLPLLVSLTYRVANVNTKHYCYIKNQTYNLSALTQAIPSHEGSQRTV